MISTFKSAAQTVNARSASASATSLPKPKPINDSNLSENVTTAFDIEKENNINLINKRRKEAGSLTSLHKRQPSDPISQKQPTA